MAPTAPLFPTDVQGLLTAALRRNERNLSYFQLRRRASSTEALIAGLVTGVEQGWLLAYKYVGAFPQTQIVAPVADVRANPREWSYALVSSLSDAARAALGRP
jgi:hypothetical protein